MVDPVADLHLVERWIRAVDEYERMIPLLRKTRLVKGSMGQLVMSPLEGYINRLEATIFRCETELGLGPMARVRLGIAYQQARQQTRLEQAPGSLSPPVAAPDPRKNLMLVQ